MAQGYHGEARVMIRFWGRSVADLLSPGRRRVKHVKELTTPSVRISHAEPFIKLSQVIITSSSCQIPGSS